MPTYERIILPNRDAIDNQRVIVSPLSLGVTGEDNLRLSIVTSVAPIVVSVHIRFLDEGGDTRAWSQDLLVGSTYTIVPDNFALGKGYLLNATVFVKTGAPRVGETYAFVDIIRGLGGAAISLGTILGGYITARQALGWPGSPIQPTTVIDGYIQRINQVGPAPGLPLEMVVPDNAHWTVLSVDANLLCDGTVATRRPVLIPVSTSPEYYAHHPQTLTAGQSGQFYWANGLTGNIDTTATPNTAAMATRTELQAGDIVRVTATNLQAGDQFLSGNVAVLERLEVK